MPKIHKRPHNFRYCRSLPAHLPYEPKHAIYTPQLEDVVCVKHCCGFCADGMAGCEEAGLYADPERHSVKCEWRFCKKPAQWYGFRFDQDFAPNYVADFGR